MRARRSGNRALRISVWCQFCWPEVSAPSRRLLDFGRLWVERGHRVSIVTGMPNHPSGVIPQRYRGKVWARESHEGVSVLRSWVYATPNRAGLRKVIGHLSFALSSVALSGPRMGRTDIVIGSSPTFFAMYSAWLWARIRRAPFVLEVRDLWPDVFFDLGVLRRGPLLWLLGQIVRFLYARADHIVVVTESFGARIAAQGVPKAKISTITNGADVEWFGEDVSEAAARRRSDLGLDGRFVVAYIGAHGVSHALRTVLEAAESCPSDRVRFLLVGDGSEKARLDEYRRTKRLRNVVMLPTQPADQIREFYALADVCLVPLRNVRLFEAFIPSKMFEIMAAGRPIIASVRGESRRILASSGAAVLVDPEDSGALLRAVLELEADDALRSRLAQAGPAYVAEHFSRRALGQRYADLLQALAG
jgi:glycosyltransferase involved in cell wall biosynthesis